MNKQQPFSEKIESSIISSCLLFEENADKAVDGLSPSDFYKGKNRRIFAAIAEAHKEGKTIDEAIVADKMGEEFSFDPRDASGDIESHIEILKEYSRLRSIIKECQKAEHKAYDKQPSDEILGELNHLFEETTTSDIVSVGDAVKEAVERNAAIADGDITLGMKTGLDVDDVIGGYEDGKLYIIAARPAMGKSAYALHIMQSIASCGVPVGMLSLEMTSMSLANRILIAAMGIDGMRLRNGDITRQEREQMFRIADNIKDLPIYFDDNSHVTAASLKAKANILKRKYGMGMLVIDYLQLMSGDNDRREREVAEISRTCKVIAKDMGIPVIALSQLSRAVEQRNIKRPQLSDLRESGAIEQDADCVQFLYRPAEYGLESYEKNDIFKGSTTNICEIIVGKNRDGKTGVKQQLFFADQMQWKNLDWKHE